MGTAPTPRARCHWSGCLSPSYAIQRKAPTRRGATARSPSAQSDSRPPPPAGTRGGSPGPGRPCGARGGGSARRLRPAPTAQRHRGRGFRGRGRGVGGMVPRPGRGMEAGGHPAGWLRPRLPAAPLRAERGAEQRRRPGRGRRDGMEQGGRRAFGSICPNRAPGPPVRGAKKPARSSGAAAGTSPTGLSLRGPEPRPRRGPSGPAPALSHRRLSPPTAHAARDWQELVARGPVLPAAIVGPAAPPQVTPQVILRGSGSATALRLSEPTPPLHRSSFVPRARACRMSRSSISRISEMLSMILCLASRCPSSPGQMWSNAVSACCVRSASVFAFSGVWMLVTADTAARPLGGRTETQVGPVHTAGTRPPEGAQNGDGESGSEPPALCHHPLGFLSRCLHLGAPTAGLR